MRGTKTLTEYRLWLSEEIGEEKNSFANKT